MIRIEDIVEKVHKNHPQADMDLLRRAYLFSAREHKGQKRASGESYLVHPLEVANILADMRLDEVSVATGLLHDVVEDTLVDLDHGVDQRELHVQARLSDLPDRLAEAYNQRLTRLIDREQRAVGSHEGHQQQRDHQHAARQQGLRP